MGYTKLWFIGILFLVCMGCGTTKPSKFYTLNPVSMPSLSSGSSMVTKDLCIGIGPITIPDALDRQEMVIRVNPNEIKRAEFDRWAGEFKDEITGAISQNLAELLRTDKIVTYPWKGLIPVEYQVIIHIFRFDGKPGDCANLTAKWLIVKKDREEVLLMKSTNLTESSPEADYAGLAAAQSRALAKMCRDIAENMARLSDPGFEP